MEVVLKNWAKLPEPQAKLVAFWVVSTWFADLLFAPPVMWVSGSDLARAMILFGILRCFVRRGVILAGLTPAKFLALPMEIRPTLLLCDPGSKNSELLLSSNFRGVWFPGSGGEMKDLSGAKAIFTGTRDLPQALRGRTIHIPLSPLDDDVSRPSHQNLMQKQAYFQRHLLGYRLDHWQAVRDSRFASKGLRSPARELANSLGACIPNDDQLTGQLPSLFAAQDGDDIESCSVDAALLAILWPCIHPVASPPVKMKIKAEVTAKVNTFLLASGEDLEFSAEAIGSRLALLGLDRRRTKFGSELLLNALTATEFISWQATWIRQK